MLYVYKYIFVVKGFDDALTSSGVVLWGYFFGFGSDLSLQFLI